MRPKRATQVLLDQVRIAREGEFAIIHHANPAVSGALITIGNGSASSDFVHFTRQ